MSGLRMAMRAIAASIALALPISLALPAGAATSPTVGMYGSQPATYDGVFRQSLAILGLQAAGVTPSASAVRWLLRAQCADGSFQPFRADPTAPCAPTDLESFSGPDTNGTAAAAAALHAIGTPTSMAAARRATMWLRGAQNADGGWGFLTGAPSDANSTGMVLSALKAQGLRDASVSRGQRFLTTVLTPCGAPDGGGLAWQAGTKPGGSASAQGYLGITGFLPLRTPRPLASDPTCARNLQQKVGSYLARSISTGGGLLPDAFGAGPDYTNTVNAVLGFAAAGVAKPAVAQAMGALRASVRDYAVKDGAPVPAALGLLLLAAKATGADARDFGGVDLVQQLQRSERR